MNIKYIFPVIIDLTLNSCNKTDDETDNSSSSSSCTKGNTLDNSKGVCNETLRQVHYYEESKYGNNRIITANNIPSHKVGLFGRVQNALNPNEISDQTESYTITTTPTVAATFTPLLSSTGIDYSFGILLNGVELDPVAAEPFPHEGMMSPNVNWTWNLEATNVNLGLDCNNAHLQPTGKYHYHGAPNLFLEDLHLQNNEMSLIG